MTYNDNELQQELQDVICFHFSLYHNWCEKNDPVPLGIIPEVYRKIYQTKPYQRYIIYGSRYPKKINQLSYIFEISGPQLRQQAGRIKF